MLNKSKSPQRILKCINNPKERRQFLSSLDDSIFVANDLEESIRQWLEYSTDDEYKRQFYKLYNSIYTYMDDYYLTLSLPEPNHVETYKDTENITFNGSLTQFMSYENKLLYKDSMLMTLCHDTAEYIIHRIFPETDGYKIEHEPNGRNECPDIKLTYPNGDETYIEVKSVLCSFFDDNTFKGKVNNAMKGIDQILNDMRQLEIKENKCQTCLRNITTVFFFYFCNSETGEAEYFKTYVMPAPIAIDCEFNKDGTFKKLGQKSDTNFNTVLNLKIRTPFNKYNTLIDRALLISTGYTSKGINRLIHNTEGDFYVLKKQFNDIKQKIYDILAVYKIENNTYTDCLSRVLQLFHELKGYKYNGSRFKDYILDYDKTYIKNTIIEIKRDINKAFGKGTVR